MSAPNFYLVENTSIVSFQNIIVAIFDGKISYDQWNIAAPDMSINEFCKADEPHR